MCGHEAAASTSSSAASGGEEGGESEDDSQADDPEESVSEEDLPTANIKERPKRQTRGKRTVLDGKDLVDDEEFWDHADFQDASSDSEFQGQEDSSESQDSDFSQKTPEEQTEEQEPEPVDRVKRRKLPIPGLPATRRGAAASSMGPPKVPMLRANRILRSSTMEQRQQRDETKAAAAEAAAAAAAAEVEFISVAPKREPKVSTLTQEQRLEEAVRTEERSREEFKALQSEEDERRRSRRGRRRVSYDGPRVRFVSRLQSQDSPAEPLIGGRPGVQNTVEFIACNFDDFCGSNTAPHRPETTGRTRHGPERSPAPKKMQK